MGDAHLHTYIRNAFADVSVQNNYGYLANTISLLQVCNNGTWSRVAKCVPAKCTELPDAPRNGMVVAPNLDHGMVGKFEVGGQITSTISY